MFWDNNFFGPAYKKKFKRRFYPYIFIRKFNAMLYLDLGHFLSYTLLEIVYLQTVLSLPFLLVLSFHYLEKIVCNFLWQENVVVYWKEFLWSCKTNHTHLIIYKKEEERVLCAVLKFFNKHKLCLPLFVFSFLQTLSPSPNS